MGASIPCRETSHTRYPGLSAPQHPATRFNALSRSSADQMVRSRVDTYSSWTCQTKPQLPLYRSRFRGENYSLSGTRHDLPGSPFDNDRFEKFLWKSLFSCACDLQFLTHLLDLHRREPSKVGAPEREFFEDTFAAAQHLLVAMPNPTNVIAKSTMLYRQDCWRLAALLYFNMAIRESPSPHLLKSMTSRLIESFQESDMSTAWAPFTDVLLWILFIASQAAWDITERGWFVLELKRVIRCLNLKDVGEMRSLLKSFIYRSFISEDHLCEFWKEHLS